MAVIKIVPMPGVGVPGPQGQAGQDGEGFNFRGEWVTNTRYLRNDVVTQGGSSYIANYDYQDTSGPSLDGDLWAVLAQKGEDGSGGGDADIADFVFEVLPVEDWTESFMTVANHDMNIRTTSLVQGNDADIEINSADDLRLIAYDNLGITSGGPIDITSDVGISIISNDQNSSQTWDFTTTGTLETPGSIEVDSNALISATNETRSESEAVSQVFTDSSLMIDNAEGSAIFIPLDTTAQTIAGYAYQQGSISATLNDSTVIQLDYLSQGTASEGAPALFFAFTDSISKPLADIFPFTFNGTRIITNEVNTLTLAPYDMNGETLPIEWQFGSDGTLTTPAGNVTIVNPASPGDITLSAYNGVKLSFADVEGAGLEFPDGTVQTTAYTGGAGGDLVVPTAIKDLDSDDFITFSRTSNNTARIDAPQDDLSLRSARDITLFPGTNGDGNVYIGWGDATITPNATNRVATIGDIQDLTTGNFTFDESTARVSSGEMTLEALEGDGTVAAQIKVNAGYVPIDIIAYERRDVTFGTGDWSTAEWGAGPGGGQIILTGITSINDFLNSSFNGDSQKILINNEFLHVYTGASYGNGNATIYVDTAPDGVVPITLTSLGFMWSEKSGMEINYDDSEMNINASNMDLNVRAGDDLSLSGGSDIRFYSNSNSQNIYDWTMSSNGNFELPGSGYISNPINSSGDGYGSPTIKIVPGINNVGADQHIVIDPTSPNHIHIRAGGVQDRSNAELILGGERTNVRVVDYTGEVTVTSKVPDTTNTYENIESDEPTLFSISQDLSNIQAYSNFSVDVNGILYQIDGVTYNSGAGITSISASPATFVQGNSYTIHESYGENHWTFANNGYLSGPAMGYVNVYGIQNPSTSDNLLVYSNDKVLIAGTNGEFLNDSSVASNQIATIGDLPTGATGSFVSQDGKTITVTNGIITNID